MDLVCRSKAICRFCYDPPAANNPLIAPCKCIGSIQYVHLNCLKRWRKTTDNPDFITQCQLCLENYEIPTKYPLEKIYYAEKDTVWFILSKPYIPIILTHYIYILLFQDFMKEELKKFSTVTKISPIILPNLIFFLMSTIIFINYAIYYANFVSCVKNKYLYAGYWLKIRINNVTPLPYAISVILSYCMIYKVLCPFGIFFVLLLPKFVYVHNTILTQMNTDAEL